MNGDSQPVSVARLIMLPARVKLRPLAQRPPACYGGGGGASSCMTRTRQHACPTSSSPVQEPDAPVL
jgi:hypothetical protein